MDLYDDSLQCVRAFKILCKNYNIKKPNVNFTGSSLTLSAIFQILHHSESYVKEVQVFLHITRSIIVFFTLLTSLAGYAAPVSIQSLWDGEFSRIQNESEPFYRLITSTNDNPSFVVVNYAGDVDLTGHFIQFQIRVNSYENWGGIELRLSSDNDFNNYYSIQVPYFSDPDFNIIQPNVWSNYTLSLGEAQVIGQPDKSKIKKIGFYVQGRYIDGTSFNVDLKNFEIKKSLSKAIISMTFDDGYEEQYRAAEIMNRFGLRGTAYLMSNEINQP